jgi:hypothetical protein
VKLASINLLKFNFSYWFDKPWFHNWGKLAAVLIIPSSWGSQLGAYYTPSSIFFGAVAREKEDFCKGSLSIPIFYFVIVFLYYIFSCIVKYKKLVPL